MGITNTYNSRGNAYTTTSMQLGSLQMSNTTGTNGYWAHSTTQRVGPFDYMHGNSSAGSYSGTRQRIGDFDYSRLTTPTGTGAGPATRSETLLSTTTRAPTGKR